MKKTVVVVIGSVLLSWAQSPQILGQSDTAAAFFGLQGGESPAAQTSSEKAADTGASQNRVGELIISSGDLLEISLFGTDFSCGREKAGCEVRVSGSGDIVLPLVGELKVAGLTVAEAEKVIAARFVQGGFFNNPEVTVIQKEYATQGISILGEVQKPGTYPLLGSHTLLQAISVAGGTTVKAGNDVMIIHSDHPNQPQHSDLRSPTSGSVALMPGDTVVIRA